MGLSLIIVFIHQYYRGLAPPPDSWAARPDSELAIWHLTMAPEARFTLPAAAGGSAINRMLYFIEGEELVVAEQTHKEHVALTLRAEQAADLYNPHATSAVELLLLQGRPIGEPVAHQGPFVMNIQAELTQAFADYRRTQFGGWPWKEDAVVFPREKGRFALMDGVEIYPPSQASGPTPETCTPSATERF